MILVDYYLSTLDDLESSSNLLSNVRSLSLQNNLARFSMSSSSGDPELLAETPRRPRLSPDPPAREPGNHRSRYPDSRS